MRSLIASLVFFSFVLLGPGPASAAELDSFHKQLFGYAQKAVQDKDDAKAEGLLAKILEAYPDDPETLPLAGDVFARRSKFREAATVYSRMLRRNPDDMSALLRLASARIRLKQGYEAQGALVRALGDGKFNEEQSEAAQAMLREIYDDWDVLKIMQQRKDYAAEERFHTRQIAKNPDGAALSYALRGFARHWLQRPEEARADFEKALSIGGMPEDLRAGVNNSLSEIKKSEEAERQKQEAAAVPPALPVVSEAVKTAAPARPVQPWVNVYDYFNQLDTLLQLGNDKQAERVLAKARRLPLRGEEKGIALYYQGELAWLKGDYAAAAENYDQAARTVKERFRLSAVLMRLAEYSALQGDEPAAASYAGRSAALLPDQPWKLRQTAGFFMALGDTGKAVDYYEQALRADPAQGDNRATYMGLAEAYKLDGDKSKYLEFARKYLDAAKQPDQGLSAEEEGMASFYRAELLAENDKTAAFHEYEQASRRVTEKYRLSEIYIKMAEYLAENGDADEAARFAALSAQTLPGQPWRNRQVAGVFDKIGRPEEAIAYTRLAIGQDPDDTGHGMRELAFRYLSIRDTDNFLAAHAAYIDKLTDRIKRFGKNVPKTMLQELQEARQLHADISRTWGFDSYNFGTWRKNDDYSYMTINELFVNFRLPADMYGKVYHRFNANKSRYSGTYSDPATSQTNRWESRTNLRDSSYGIFGVKLNPFSVIPDLGLGVEYLYPMGSDRNAGDTRGRVEYDKAWGEKPRPYETHWNYAKVYGELLYSTRDNDVVSFGEFRLGHAFTFDFDKNFLVIPHVRSNWNYGGEEVAKAERWGLEAGPGIAFRKWFNEDKYNAPRSYIELGVNYNIGLSHKLKNGVGFNFTFSY